MKSRITVEIDFSNNNEIVLQIKARTSDDARDKMLQHFLQSIGSATMCGIKFEGISNDEPDAPYHSVTIFPLKSQEE